VTESALDEVAATWLAGERAFNSKDLAGWFAATHPEVRTFQGDRFQTGAEALAEAPAMLEAADRFETIWHEGTVVDDSAVLWGECEFDIRIGNGPATTFLLAFSAYYVRTNGSWRSLFTHYTQVQRP
jgi:Domain of unknown function (DUF4440)